MKPLSANFTQHQKISFYCCRFIIELQYLKIIGTVIANILIMFSSN